MIPFLIVGHPRSGSTLLREAIDRHPEIRVYSELFHRVENERKCTHSITKKDGSKVYYEGGSRDALEFLFTHVWNVENEKIHAVGFKLFAERLQCIGTERLFVRLKSEVKDLRVIHIIRDNLLDMWVSREKAKQSGVWRVAANGNAAKPQQEIQPIEVNPESLIRGFDQLAKATRFLDDHFKDIPYLAVHYDQLIVNFDKEMDRVFKFFGLESINCLMTIKKQNTKPHTQFIINFDELKEFFVHTKYADFFNTYL